MTFVVTENCIKCKYIDCVEVCPVDCFHEGPNFLMIDPDECIDCTLCEPECPVEAIFSEDDVPAGQEHFKQLNADLAKRWPVITEEGCPGGCQGMGRQAGQVKAAAALTPGAADWCALSSGAPAAHPAYVAVDHVPIGQHWLGRALHREILAQGVGDDAIGPRCGHALTFSSSPSLAFARAALRSGEHHTCSALVHDTVSGPLRGYIR